MKARNAYGPLEGCTPTFGYVKLNGDTVWESSWCNNGVPPNHRGLNILLVDPLTCSKQEWRCFDTYIDASASNALHNYLQQVDEELIVGVSSGDITVQMQPIGLTALKGIGVDVSNLQYRGLVAFVARKTVLRKALTEEQTNVNPPHFTHRIFTQGTNYFS